MDATSNFCKVIASPQSSTDTTVIFSATDYAKLPAFPFNMSWWNSSSYSDPADDSNVEIVRATAGDATTYVVTITRAQEGTTAQNHNTAGVTYEMIVGATSKTISDIATLFSTFGTFTLTATGTINGTNAAFTFIQEPSIIVSDGALYRVGNGWTWTAATLTATMTIPPSSDIFGIT